MSDVKAEAAEAATEAVDHPTSDGVMSKATSESSLKSDGVSPSLLVLAAAAPNAESKAARLPEHASSVVSSTESGSNEQDNDDDDDDDEKKLHMKRKRNREHARLSRQRKRHRIEVLQEENDGYRRNYATLLEENNHLRDRLSQADHEIHRLRAWIDHLPPSHSLDRPSYYQAGDAGRPPYLPYPPPVWRPGMPAATQPTAPPAAADGYPPVAVPPAPST